MQVRGVLQGVLVEEGAEEEGVEVAAKVHVQLHHLENGSH